MSNVNRRLFLATSAAALAGHAGEAAPALAERLSGLYAAARREGEVVYYTSSRTEEARGLSKFWKSNFPAVRLTILSHNAPDLITQIEAEKNAGQMQVDVTTITLPYVAVQWQKQGMYQPYKVAAAAQLGSYGTPDGAYYVTGFYLLPPAYNTGAFPSGNGLPHNLRGFLDPALKGKLVLADPRTAGNSLTFFLGLLQLGKIDWNWIEALGRQDVLFVKGNPEAARLVAAGERPLSPIVSTLNSLPAKLKGQPLDFYALDEGSVVAERPSGIIAGARHPNASRLLMETLTSAEGQQALAGAGLFWPTNSACAPVGGLPALAALKPIRVDLAAISSADQTSAFLAKFEQVFGRS